MKRDEAEYEFEIDAWARWDQPSDFTQYYDLRENPERNTEYNGLRKPLSRPLDELFNGARSFRHGERCPNTTSSPLRN